MSPILVIYNVCFGVDLLVYKDNEHVYHMLNMHWWGLTKNAKFQYIISAKFEFRINWDFFFYKICNSSFVSATVNCKHGKIKQCHFFQTLCPTLCVGFQTRPSGFLLCLVHCRWRRPRSHYEWPWADLVIVKRKNESQGHLRFY